MNIPTFINDKWIGVGGSLTPVAYLYHDELNRALQGALSDNGWTLPQQTFAVIQSIESEMPNGTLWYDTTNNRVVVKIGGGSPGLYELDMTLIP